MKHTECETELVERSKQDVDCFGELVERYRSAIYALCHGRVRDRNYAEDLAQETFVRACLKLEQLQDPSRFGGWLRKIASNVCSEFMRSPARQEWACETLPETTMEAPDTSDDGFLSKLDALHEDTRECMVMFYVEGRSYSEIAERLGTSVAAARNRIYRGKLALREEMGDLGEEPRHQFTARVMRRLRALKSADPKERARAAGELSAALAEDRVEWMVKQLTQSDLMYRSAAIRSSRKILSPRVRDVLLDMVLADEWEENRIKAASALVAQGDPSVVPALRRFIEAERVPHDVANAVKSAIRQLEKLEPKPASEAEERSLRTDLAEAGSDRASRVELMRRLKEPLSDPDSKVRARALRALGDLGDRRAVPPIAELLRRDSSPGIRQAAAAVLGKLGGRGAVTALFEATDSSDDRMLLRTVVRALGETGMHDAVPALIRSIGKGDPGVLVFTTRALEKLVRTEDLPAIRARIDEVKARPDLDPARIWTAHLDGLWASVLSAAADRTYLDETVTALDRDPTNVPLMDALGRIGDPRAADVLLRAMAFNGPPVPQAGGHSRYSAAMALRRLGEPGMEAMRRALKSDNPLTKHAAVRAMFFGGADTSAEQTLTELAEGEETASTKLFAKGYFWRRRRGL